MIGEKLGPYEITEEIGKGGMATVYRAYQPSMDRHVAVKVIRASMLGDSVGRDRFQREAKLVAKLEHPHLLPVYDFDGAHDPPYIVMRFLEGGTLKQVMDADPLPRGELLYMLHQVASALDYAHRQGVVHRDLKPSNIMIDKEGNAFIADFGIARVSDAPKDLTGTGNVIGTPGYIAPEQARGQAEVDGRADVYSLGVIAFELLAGQGPYDRENPVDELMAHLQEPIPDITAFNPELNAEVNEAMRKSLAKDPEERYTTTGEMIEGLSKALNKRPSGSPSQLRTLTQTFAVEQLVALEAAPPEVKTSTDVQRQMTALYMDVTDYADLLYESEETDAVQKETDRLWHAFEGIASDHGGALESRTGEAGLLLWGRELTHESDAEQGILAALQMREAIAVASRRHWGESHGGGGEEPLPFKAGITSGPVLLTREGSGDSTASGTTITLAGRLKESAPPGEILIAHDSYSQVRGVFTVRQLPPVRMRGRAEALDVYEVVEAKPRAFRQQTRGIEGVETKMIGREPELKILQDALTLTVEDGETQVVTVVGEAGVGKSRLLYEFSNWADLVDQVVWFFQARATQPSMLQPYSLTRDLFSFRFQILDNDPLPVVHEKFEQGIAEFVNGSSPDLAPMIGQLVGFDFSESPVVKPKLEDPESFHREALDKLGQFFLTATKTNPVLIQVEDIHWADERSLDLLNSLARENTEIPLFIIYMARPELYDRRPSWGEGQQFHARFTLNPLSRLDSRRLVRELLKRVGKVPNEVRDLIIDRAEGNPYYMEELVKALIDGGVIVKGEDKWTIELTKLTNVRVPPTLVGVLQSRLDSFPPGQRALMQRASVIGRIFWESSAAHLSTSEGVTAGAVSSMLNDLRRREMVFKREESAFEGTAEYGFRHAILRDVVYETIVPRQRRAYHKTVAEWLLEAGSDRLDEYNLLIAEHYELAQASRDAAQYLGRAGKVSQQRGARTEAAQLLERALSLLHPDRDVDLQMNLQLQLGVVFSELGRYEKAKAQLTPALESARAAEAEYIQATALAELGRIAGVFQGDRVAGSAYFAEALPIARKLEDERVLIFVLRQLGNIASSEGQLEAARTYLEESLELAKQVDDRSLEAQACNSLAIVASVSGDSEAALAYYDRGIQLGREIGEIPVESLTMAGKAEVYVDLGRVERGVGLAREALELADETESHFLISGALFSLGYALIEQRKIEEARSSIGEALRLNLEMQSPYFVVNLLPSYARLRALDGDPTTSYEWLGLARSHPTADSVLEWEVGKALEWIQDEGVEPKLSEEEIEAALARGANLDLNELVAELHEASQS